MKSIIRLLIIFSILIGIQGLVFARSLKGIEGGVEILPYGFSMGLGGEGSSASNASYSDAAFISGASSLLLALCPNLSPDQVVDMINLATENSGVLNNQEFITNLKESVEDDCK